MVVTEKDLALLHSRSVRDLKLELHSLVVEWDKCFNLYRRRWISSRMTLLQEIINTKNMP